MPVNVDPQIIGVFDDGTIEGAIRARVAELGLTMQPFRYEEYDYSWATGSAQTFLPYHSTYSPGNIDGTGSSVRVKVPNKTPANGDYGGGSFTFWVYGPVVGLRWRRGGVSNTRQFGVMIDGVAYDIANAFTNPITGNAASEGRENTCMVVLARNLPDLPNGDPHVVTLTFTARTSGGDDYWVLYGYLADRAAGYKDWPHTAVAKAPVVLGNGSGNATEILTSSNVSRGIVKVVYYNYSVSSAVITVRSGTTDIWKATLAAGACTEWVPGEGVPVLGGYGAAGATDVLSHYADAATAIRATIVIGV